MLATLGSGVDLVQGYRATAPMRKEQMLIKQAMMGGGYGGFGFGSGGYQEKVDDDTFQEDDDGAVEEDNE